MKPLITLALLLAGANVQAQQEPAKPLAYEVVAINPNVTADGNTSVHMHGGSMMMSNMGLKELIEHAYGLKTDEQLLGLPGWAASAHFDVNAKMDEDTAARFKALRGRERDVAEEHMTQAFLAERFGLKIHHETRDLPEYALVAAKGGPKLKPADPAQSKSSSSHSTEGKVEASSVDTEWLTFFLSYQVRRNVVDRTGLTGKFDLALTYTPEDQPNSAADGAADKAPGLFTALQEQLGLRLESIKGPVDTVVVDQIQQPTEN